MLAFKLDEKGPEMSDDAWTRNFFEVIQRFKKIKFCCYLCQLRICPEHWF